MDLKFFLEWLALVIGLAGGLAPIVSSLVAMVKTALGDRLPARYYPTVAVAIGITLAVFVSWISLGWPTPIDWRVGLLVGTLAGLGAAKLFELGKAREEVPHG